VIKRSRHMWLCYGAGTPGPQCHIMPGRVVKGQARLAMSSVPLPVVLPVAVSQLRLAGGRALAGQASLIVPETKKATQPYNLLLQRHGVATRGPALSASESKISLALAGYCNWTSPRFGGGALLVMRHEGALQTAQAATSAANERSSIIIFGCKFKGVPAEQSRPATRHGQ